MLFLDTQTLQTAEGLIEEGSTNPVMIAVLGISVLFLIVAVFLFIKSMVKTKDQTVVSSEKTVSIKYEEVTYSIFSSNPITRPLLRRAEYKLLPFYPATIKSENSYMKPLAKMILKCVFWTILVFTLVFALRPTIYMFVTAVFLSYAMCTQSVLGTIKNEEIAFLGELDTFLASIKHYFYQTNSVREALLLTANTTTQKKMKMVAEELYEVLSAEDTYIERKKYMASSRSKYLKLFLLFAERVNEDGDIVDAEGSVFLSSIMQIRSDIQEERRLIQDKKHKFNFLGVIAAIIAVTLPYIQDWGIDTLPALSTFYHGRFGAGMMVLGFLLCYGCYRAIYLLQGDADTEGGFSKFFVWLSSVPPISAVCTFLVKRNAQKSDAMADRLRRLGSNYPVRAVYAKKIVFFILSIVICTIVLITGHRERRHEILTETASLEEVSPTADGRQIEALKKIIPEYVARYVEEGREDETVPEPEPLIQELYENELALKTKDVCADASTEIRGRVTDYFSEEFDFIDIIIIFVMSFLMYLMPNLGIIIQAMAMNSAMQQEVISFQGIIRALSRVPGVTPMLMLEAMEEFAKIFRKSIQNCLNEYPINDIEALQRMRAAEDYPGFRRLVDNFLMVDESGVQLAFEEVSAETKNFREDKKLEAAIALDNITTFASMVSMIPAMVVLFFYLLTPFMVKTLSMFSSYSDQLSNLASGY